MTEPEDLEAYLEEVAANARPIPDPPEFQLVEDTAEKVAPVTPDHTKSQDNKDNFWNKLGWNPPKETTRKQTNIPRTKPRRLTKSDQEKLAGLYGALGFGLMPFKPDVAQAVMESADTCAEAWIEVAEKNDNVRRILVGMIEGGSWGKLLLAHLPIIVAAMPENVGQVVPLHVFNGHADQKEDETV